MLHEDMERQAVRRMVRQAQKEQMIPSKEKRKETRALIDVIKYIEVLLIRIFIVC